MAERKADQEALFASVETLNRLKLLRKIIGDCENSINDDTARELTAKVHDMIAGCHSSLAILERIKRIRDQQSTSKPGGGRRKAKKE